MSTFPYIHNRAILSFLLILPIVSAWITTTTHPKTASVLLKLSREEYLQPHFGETKPTLKKTKVYDFDWERVLVCAQSITGSCDLEEMEQMMQELKAMDVVDGATFGAFLSSQDGETRQALKHALESQVELAKARKELAALGLELDTEELAFPKLEEPLQTEAPSVVVTERDIQELLQQMRNIAEHEEH